MSERAEGLGEGAQNAAPRVLVVDDDEILRRAIGATLERIGIESGFAADGEEALQAIREGDIDLVLCDVCLPGEDGLELVKRFREVQSDLAVVMVSGETDPLVSEAAIEQGASGYLIKPFAPEHLRFEISKAMRRRATSDAC